MNTENISDETKLAMVTVITNGILSRQAIVPELKRHFAVSDSAFENVIGKAVRFAGPEAVSAIVAGDLNETARYSGKLFGALALLMCFVKKEQINLAVAGFRLLARLTAGYSANAGDVIDFADLFDVDGDVMHKRLTPLKRVFIERFPEADAYGVFGRVIIDDEIVGGITENTLVSVADNA